MSVYDNMLMAKKMMENNPGSITECRSSPKANQFTILIGNVVGLDRYQNLPIPQLPIL